MRIAYVVTVPGSAQAFLQGQLRYFAASGHEVRLFSRGEPLLNVVARSEGVSAEALPLEREIALWADLKALWLTYRAFRRFRPHLSNVGTPKAGLIGGLAAVFARVPARIYVMHGLRLETARGPKARILSFTERLACKCAHHVLCVSPSVRERAIALKLVSECKAQILGSGTVNGVDLERFAALPSDSAALALRRQLGLPESAKVIGFIGRFTRDKGVNELIDAFTSLELEIPNLRMLMLGDFEAADPVTPATRARIERGGSLIWPGSVADTAPYYHLMDVLALPTYREGYPTVCLEAAAAGVPIVATTATGAKDAVVDGVTGRLVPIGDPVALADALRELLLGPARAQEFGQAAQRRIRDEYQSERIWNLLDNFYAELLAGGRGHGVTGG